MRVSAACRRYACPSCTDNTCRHSCHTTDEALFSPSARGFGEPERPYVQEGQKSAGWSGTDTSKAAEPIRAESQKQVLMHVHRQTSHGATVKEVRDATGLHHGVASGALSVLHKKKYLARLLTKRDGSRVYCHPDYLAGRDHD